MIEFENMLGTLHIVATPIGNLQDMTFRSLKILREVDVILTEDTRVARKLMSRYKIDTPLKSYHQHSSENKKLEILSLLTSGKNIALISDAGTPGISDPGNELIDFVLEKEPNIKVVPVPGPSAITSALSVSGFDVNKFVFLGFLPKKKRGKLFEWLKKGPSAGSGRMITFAFYESPNRILKTLDVLEEEFGSKGRIFVARELTKLHETLYRGYIHEVRKQLQKDKIKGEIVVVVERSGSIPARVS